MFQSLKRWWGGRQSEDKLRAFLESASQGILAVDCRGAILLVNEKTEEMFGYSRQELLGHPVELLLPEGYRSAHSGHRAEYFRNPRKRPMGVGLDLTGRKKDGSEFPVEISLSHVRDGRESVALAFVTDITGRKRNEERLREAAKLESLGVLAGGIAHDFNNLLVGIMGNASLALEETVPGSPARGMLRGVIEASERAASLVRQLLAYSGKGRFQIGPVDLSKLVAESAGIMRTSVAQAVKLRFELADGLPAIETDASQMQQLVMNLVINGGEAIGERPGTVVVRTAFDPEPAAAVRLEVQDDGCGMDAATKERIFDPFFSTKFTGRGLGLAAVQGIVRTHRGSIEVQTALGRGSKFTVRLPVSVRKANEAGQGSAARGVGRNTVLLADDEEVVRSSAKFALEKHGYKVLLARDGDEVIRIFQRDAAEVALVVLDLTMPVMSGLETLRRLRAMRPDVPVVLSGALSDAGTIGPFRAEGAAGFLQKPYTAAQITSQVQAALAVGRPRTGGAGAH